MERHFSVWTLSCRSLWLLPFETQQRLIFESNSAEKNPCKEPKLFPHNTAPNSASCWTRCVIITVDIWPEICFRFSPRCISDCGQLKERVKLDFSIPVNRKWYFYWNRSVNWHFMTAWPHLRPGTRIQPLRGWNNIFHGLWLLSDPCSVDTAQRWDTIFHKILQHASTTGLQLLKLCRRMRQHFRGFPSLRLKDSLCNVLSCGWDLLNRRMLEKVSRHLTVFLSSWSPDLFVSSCHSFSLFLWTQHLKSFSMVYLCFRIAVIPASKRREMVGHGIEEPPNK